MSVIRLRREKKAKHTCHNRNTIDFDIWLRYMLCCIIIYWYLTSTIKSKKAVVI